MKRMVLGLALLFWCAVAGAAETPAVPDGVQGFRGMLLGTLKSKGKTDLVVKVEKVLRVWKGSKAKNPQAAVGKELALTIMKPESRWSKRLIERLNGLVVGDRIEVGALYTEGGVLRVGEVLQKASNIPLDARWFRGTLVGTIKSKAEASFVLKVEKVGKLWRRNHARKPELLVGMELTLKIRQKPKPAEHLLAALEGLAVGDRVKAGALYVEGAFMAAEVLQKVE